MSISFFYEVLAGSGHVQSRDLETVLLVQAYKRGVDHISQVKMTIIDLESIRFCLFCWN
jgi:hypothetical protein